LRHVDEHDVIAIAVDVIAKKTIERLPRGEGKGGKGVRVLQSGKKNLIRG